MSKSRTWSYFSFSVLKKKIYQSFGEVAFFLFIISYNIVDSLRDFFRVAADVFICLYDLMVKLTWF